MKTKHIVDRSQPIIIRTTEGYTMPVERAVQTKTNTIPFKHAVEWFTHDACILYRTDQEIKNYIIYRWLQYMGFGCISGENEDIVRIYNTLLTDSNTLCYITFNTQEML